MTSTGTGSTGTTPITAKVAMEPDSPKKSQSKEPSSSTQKKRYYSVPYSTKKQKSLDPSLENNKHSIFSSTYQHSGFLDVRTNHNKPWKRRYFVVNNNFLLSAATPHATKLESMISLEGSKISKHLKSTDMTFELYVRKHKLYFRTASPKQCETWTKAIEKASKLKIKDIYRFLYELGEANIKVVAAKHRATNEDCAIKIVDKRQCDKKMLRTEIQILKKIDHPSIVPIYDLIETKKYLYVVMQKCEGGELFDRVAELDGDGFSEEDTCMIMHQLCDAVKYMNDQGIVHRDLKPENILCVHPNSIRQIKVCDFGISKMFKGGKNMKEEKMNTLVGTAFYTAPEVIRPKTPYDYTCDYWSIGVIMYILLCGYPPFGGENDVAIQQNILHNEVEFEQEDWEHITDPTKKLVAGLLNKNPKQRLGPDDVLKLTWKVSAKSVSAKRSHHRFKQTVLKTKLQRHSLSKFEADSGISRQMFMFRPQTIDNAPSIDEEQKETSYVALNNSRQSSTQSSRKSLKRSSRISQKAFLTKDDMDETDQHKIEAYERKIAAFRTRTSKGTEELLSLKLPMSWTHAQLSVIEDEDGDD